MKCRVFDGVEMREVVELDLSAGVASSKVPGTYFFKHYPIKDVMRFTGYKDINGNEVYEEDICQDEDGSVGVVRWHKDLYGYKFFYAKNDWADLDEFYGLWSLQIVGNTFQNKELLDESLLL